MCIINTSKRITDKQRYSDCEVINPTTWQKAHGSKLLTLIALFFRQGFFDPGSHPWPMWTCKTPQRQSAGYRVKAFEFSTVIFTALNMYCSTTARLMRFVNCEKTATHANLHQNYTCLMIFNGFVVLFSTKYLVRSLNPILNYIKCRVKPWGL